MSKVDTCEEELIRAIHESSVYRQFEESKANLAGHPDYKVQIDAFREKVYLMQKDGGDDYIEGGADALFAEREKLYENPLIADYLNTECRLCRMLQRICMDIVGIADLEISSFEDKIFV